MQLNQRNTINRVGKSLAKPLSLMVANPLMQDFSRLIEAYWCILLGKGAGTDWAIEGEVKAARFAIQTKTPIIFDIGANKGHWSLMLHQIFPEAQIFMFEPQPVCQQLIKDLNLALVISTLVPSFTIFGICCIPLVTKSTASCPPHVCYPLLATTKTASIFEVQPII